MTIFLWNCRGLARGPAVRALRALIRKEDPALLFLMETKISSEALNRTARNLGFISFVSVPSVGTRGGLALLWRPGV